MMKRSKKPYQPTCPAGSIFTMEPDVDAFLSVINIKDYGALCAFFLDKTRMVPEELDKLTLYDSVFIGLTDCWSFKIGLWTLVPGLISLHPIPPAVNGSGQVMDNFVDHVGRRELTQADFLRPTMDQAITPSAFIPYYFVRQIAARNPGIVRGELMQNAEPQGGPHFLEYAERTAPMWESKRQKYRALATGNIKQRWVEGELLESILESLGEAEIAP